MQAEHVSLGVDGEGDEAVLADGKLLLVDASARFRDAALLDRTVFAAEINQSTVAAGGNALHLDQGTAGARAVHLHRKRPHVHSRAVELLQLALEDGFVEFFGAIHVLHVDLEPDRGILPHRDSPVSDGLATPRDPARARTGARRSRSGWSRDARDSACAAPCTRPP